MMTFKQFCNLAKEHKTVPVYERVLADLLTPVSAYMRIAKDFPYSFLLESVEKGTQYARYSFLGVNPKRCIIHQDNKTTIIENGKTQDVEQSIIDILHEISGNYNTPKISDIPGFTGGLVGYIGYEAVTWIEDIPIHHKESVSIPDAVFMLFEDMIAFDHLKGQVIVFSNVNIEDQTDLQTQYKDAISKINKIGESLHTDIDYQTPITVEESKLHTNMTKPDFLNAVKKVKKHISAGDIFQLVLSQRFHRHTTVESINIYRALRSINPSPYMFHFQLDEFQIIGASPELLVKVEDGEIELRPIAGTRHRGENEKEDQLLANELLSDKKERAEHLMLLDLGRNDVGRAADFGSVKVNEFMEVENYSHVMHIVSDVRGKLQEGKNVMDALFGGFPAGTVSGAPKIRAMELINELEPTRRNIYSGAVGYIDFRGNMNTCIAIRTMLKIDDTVYFQSGAGIVYDSDPEKEYEETVNKAKAIMSAIDFAEKGLI